MNDKELDEYLSKGKKESDKFFSQIQFSSLRKALIHKVSHPDAVKTFVPKRKSFALAAGISAVACAILALTFYFCFYNNIVQHQEPSKSLVAEQSVPLNDDKNKEYIS
jgi:uncharacterized membrane protein YbhN (UPF0104 family)